MSYLSSNALIQTVVCVKQGDHFESGTQNKEPLNIHFKFCKKFHKMTRVDRFGMKGKEHRCLQNQIKSHTYFNHYKESVCIYLFTMTKMKLTVVKETPHFFLHASNC